MIVSERNTLSLVVNMVICAPLAISPFLIILLSISFRLPASISFFSFLLPPLSIPLSSSFPSLTPHQPSSLLLFPLKLMEHI